MKLKRKSRGSWLSWVLVILVVISIGRDFFPRKEARAANGQTGFPVGGTITALGYNRDQQTAVFRAGLSTADTNSLSTLLGVAANDFTLSGRPNISISGRFSVGSSNTCQVRVVWVYQTPAGVNYVLGVSNLLTLTASTAQDQVTSYYIAPDVVFDGSGATDCWVQLVTAPTGGGTVDLWVGSW
jgi:hypothetical protein